MSKSESLSGLTLSPQKHLLQVVSFRLSNEVYALDILNVQEIIRVLPITHVPRAMDWVQGVINLRGQIIPLLCPAQRLHLVVDPITRHSRFIIMRQRDQAIGLIVDEVLEVLRIPPQALEAPPQHLAHRDFIQAVSKQERGMVIILDPNKVLAHPTLRNEALLEAV